MMGSFLSELTVKETQYRCSAVFSGVVYLPLRSLASSRIEPSSLELTRYGKLCNVSFARLRRLQLAVESLGCVARYT